MGISRRFAYAFRSFFSILGNGEIPEDIARELISPAPATEPVKAPVSAIDVKPASEVKCRAEGAVQILAILQRHARLIDFFTEDLSPYSDAQVGSAIRSLQKSCQEALTRYIKLAPMIASAKGQKIRVEEEFDRATIRVIGGAKRNPPFEGQVQHGGWQVVEVNLPPLTESNVRLILAPAEVEVEAALEATGDE